MIFYIINISVRNTELLQSIMKGRQLKLVKRFLLISYEGTSIKIG